MPNIWDNLGSFLAGIDWALLANVSQVVATLGLVVTIIVTGLDVRQNRAIADRAHKASEAAAQRAEAAAAVTVDQMTRIAKALEDIAAKPSSGSVVTAPPARVAWSLRHFNGDKYILENIGDATAENVRLSAHESLMTPGELPEEQDLGPGEALTFMAVRNMGTSDSTITVKWNDGAESDRVWKYPLPPRPPR